MDSLNEAGYQRWVRTEWWEQGYDRLWTEGDAGVIAGVKEGSSRSKSEIEKVVYLTADANEELEELKEDETYIIGGICDHNRYKVGHSYMQNASALFIFNASISYRIFV